jgi:hypothetical protein
MKSPSRHRVADARRPGVRQRGNNAEFGAGAIVDHAPASEGVVEGHPHPIGAIGSRVVLRVDPDADLLSRLLHIGGQIRVTCVDSEREQAPRGLG